MVEVKLVAPGTYSEVLIFPLGQITVKGQDANGCILDLNGMGSILLSSPSYYPPKTLSGFTIRGGGVETGWEDTISECIFQDSPTFQVRGGGMVTNCVFDNSSPVSIDVPWNNFMMVANSIFLSLDDPFSLEGPTETAVYLLNNDFVNWFGWQNPWFFYQGEGNFSEDPRFVYPGPPVRYFVEPFSLCVDTAADVGLPYSGYSRDVGVFEFGLNYTARPPSVLTAEWQKGPGIVLLAWVPSPDDDFFWPEYHIFRSEFPDFPWPDGEMPYATVPTGIYSYDDHFPVYDKTLYYKVKAYNGVLSEATNVASANPQLNIPPVAVDDAYSVDEDNVLNVAAPGVLGNDSDVEGDPLTAVLVTGPANDTLMLNADGSFSYDPDIDFFGSDSFTYKANDGLLDSNTATVTITINAVNDAPVAVDDAYETDEDQGFIVIFPGVLFNDYDIDSASLMAILVAGPSHASSFSLGLLGGFGYTPVPDFFGEDTFTCRVSDGESFSNTATVTITVNPVPDIHIDLITMGIVNERGKTGATAEVLVIDEEGAPVGDVYVEGTWSYTDRVTGGTEQMDTDYGHTAADGTLIVQSDLKKKPDGTFTFTIDPLKVSKTGYTFDEVNSVLANSIQYPPPAQNDPPVANDDSATIIKNTVVTIDVLANDSDPNGDPLTVDAVIQPANGLAVINPDYSIAYTPNTGFIGVDPFTYTVGDGQGGFDTATVNVTVTETQPDNKMHVFAIDMVLSGKKVVNAKAIVTVVDASGAPVSGVQVSGDWSGVVSGSSSGITDTTGVVTLNSPGTKNYAGQTFTFTVTDLVKVGWIYDEPANVETSDSITAP